MATESHHGSVCPGYTRCSLQLEKSSVFGVNPCKTQLKIGRQHSSKLYIAAQSTLSASEMFSVCLWSHVLCLLLYTWQSSLRSAGEERHGHLLYFSLHLAVQTSSHPCSPVLPSIQFCKAILDSLLVSPLWECVKQTHEKFLVRFPRGKGERCLCACPRAQT